MDSIILSSKCDSRNKEIMVHDKTIVDKGTMRRATHIKKLYMMERLNIDLVEFDLR